MANFRSLQSVAIEPLNPLMGISSSTMKLALPHSKTVMDVCWNLLKVSTKDEGRRTKVFLLRTPSKDRVEVVVCFSRMAMR